MKLVYFSHSFRDNDIDVNKHFVTLLSNRGLEVNLDAFTKPGELNAAQPMRQIRYNDGLVAVWPWRAGEISKFIPFEIMLGVRAKKPVLVFIEDKLPEDILPLGILQCRFRREYLVREIKRHYHSIDLFNSYLPENPPPSYSINISRRICLLVSDPGVQEPVKAAVRDELTDSGYHVDELDSSSELAVSDEKLFRRVLATDLAIIISEGDSQPPKFITGILIGHLVPSVMFTLASNPKISNNSPE